MELHVKFTRKIDEIQRKLREANYQCNRLREEVERSIPDLIASLRDAESRKPIAPPVDPESDLKPEVTQDIPASPPVVDLNLTPAPPAISLPVSLPESAETPSDTPAPVSETPDIPAVDIAAISEADPETESEPRSKAKPKPKPATKKPSLRGSLSWEEFIGGNLLNKIGIAILIIGIGIFVKYAIDKDWIGAAGRVMIGLLSGGILLGIAHRLRERYKAFSSVLLGGGIAVLYFSVAIAFQPYQLLSQSAAFAIMCIITAATVLFSVSYNRQEIAILALAGAFITPFLVSTGSGNYVALFLYLAVVNAGMMVLSWFRDWQLVRMLSYGVTLLLFGGWLVQNQLFSEQPDPTSALLFGTLYFLMFFAMNIAFNVRARKPLNPMGYIMLLSNSAIYFGGAMLTLSQVQDGRYMGLYTALMAVFHFAFIFPVRKMLKEDKNLHLLLIGMVLTFLTLAIPIQLEGSFITLFWAAEAVVLLVLAQRSEIELLRKAAQLVTALSLVGLVWDWALLYAQQWPSGRTPIVNGAFVTSMFTAAMLLVQHLVYKREAGGHKESAFLSQLYQTALLPVLYIGILIEMMDQMTLHSNAMMLGVAVTAYTALFLSAMMGWALNDRREGFGNTVMLLSGLGFIVFLAVHFSVFVDFRNMYINGVGAANFGMHFLMVPPLFLLLGLVFVHLRRHTDLRSEAGKIVLWALSIVFIVLCSLELDNLLVMAGVSLKNAHKVGYPILWGCIGFVMIFLGMKHKLLQLRIAGLALFSLILLKLFVYDIRNVSTGGKIAAFISLGILLLVISFLYQRLKKLLFEPEMEQMPQEAEAS
ncbi:MAG: DUF2339 domain-containing protein [Bacteroidota bacterium]